MKGSGNHHQFGVLDNLVIKITIYKRVLQASDCVEMLYNFQTFASPLSDSPVRLCDSACPPFPLPPSPLCSDNPISLQDIYDVFAKFLEGKTLTNLQPPLPAAHLRPPFSYAHNHSTIDIYMYGSPFNSLALSTGKVSYLPWCETKLDPETASIAPRLVQLNRFDSTHASYMHSCTHTYIYSCIHAHRYPSMHTRIHSCG